jgi:thiosulfate/3-mercaptopyruvate sulfurtransferase
MTTNSSTIPAGFPLISAERLGALLSTASSSRRVRVLDVRWSLARPDGQEAFDQEHIPGSVYVDLETELSRRGEPREGRHPLPNIDRLQDAARRWGLNDGDQVVVVDDLHGQSAARAWWLLRWAGLIDVTLLDGGLAAWRRAGLPLVTSATDPHLPPSVGNVRLTSGHLPTMTADEAGQQAATGVLLDARAAERYRGEVEPIDPRAGHIPGAVSAPTTENVDESGLFRSATELRRRFSEFGANPETPVGVYCGSGVTAAHTAIALTIAGYQPVLFPGSWSAWASDPERPVATGAEPQMS